LPSMEEFEKLVAESFQEELIPTESAAEETDAVQAAMTDLPETEKAG